MGLVSGLEILAAARAGKYGVGAFNTNDLEITQAIIEAAEETRSPVIVALSEGGLKYGGDALVALVRYLAERASVPVAIHLDHGSSFASCMRAIRLGFTSVMIDMSHEDEETNIAETRRVVEAAHAVGVTVEAEIGRLGGIEEHVVVSAEEATLTKPDEALRFMQATGADYLAVAIGTSHGPNKGKGRPYIDHDRIREIAALVPAPLVMHGASGVPSALVERFRTAGGEIKDASGIHEDDVRQAVTQGIAKINTDTDLRLAFTTAVREVLRDTPKEFDPRKLLGPARDEMRRVVVERIGRVVGRRSARRHRRADDAGRPACGHLRDRRGRRLGTSTAPRGRRSGPAAARAAPRSTRSRRTSRRWCPRRRAGTRSCGYGRSADARPTRARVA